MDLNTLASQSRSLAAEVENLPRARMVAFVVACAARTAPLFRLFRGASPPSSVEDAIGQMWVAIEKADFDAIPQVFASLAALPEVGDPDNQAREYIALQAIASCHGPAAAVDSPHPREEIFKAIAHVGDLARELDGDLGYEDLTGPLLALESAAEYACYRALAKDPTGPLPIEELMRLCQPVIDAYVEAAPQVAGRRGWEIAS